MLNGKAVLVTGALGRIGRAVATGVVENGGHVVMVDVDADRGAALAENLGPANAVFCLADITDPGSIDSALAIGTHRFGRLSGAIDCAYPKSSGWGARFEEIDAEHLRENLFAQLGGTILLAQRVLRQFRETGGGSLLLTSSIQGVSAPKFDHYEGTEMTSPIEYSATKAGIIAVTRWLAKYHRNLGISVNCISPGGILDQQPESFVDRYRASCTSKGLLDAADLVGTATFLLSDSARFINGQNIVVDDGWSL